MKFNKGQNLAVKQCQDKTRFLQKRQQDNTARVARGEDPVPDEDINKLFKPLPPINRLNALVLSGQINSSAHQVSQFCSQSLAKWFATEALQQAKMSDTNPWKDWPLNCIYGYNLILHSWKKLVILYQTKL